MASIRKRGGSYLLVVSMGYTPDGRRRNPQQKTVKPPAGLIVIWVYLSCLLSCCCFCSICQSGERGAESNEKTKTNHGGHLKYDRHAV